MIKKLLLLSSFRRMPESMAHMPLDSGMRRNDEIIFLPKFLNTVIPLLLVLSACLLTLVGCSSAPPIPTNSFYRLDIGVPKTRLTSP